MRSRPDPTPIDSHPPAPPGSPRPPHSATLPSVRTVQPMRAAPQLPPHPATVVQPRMPFGAGKTHPPHPATLPRRGAAQPRMGAPWAPPHPAVAQRAQAGLSEVDQQKFLTRVREDFPEFEADGSLKKVVESVISSSSTYEDAAKAFDAKKGFFSKGPKVKAKESKRPSLKPWIIDKDKEKNRTLDQLQTFVDMGEEKTVQGKGRFFIVWTQSLGGCLGVAAHNAKTGNGFLAHYMPTQISELKDTERELKSVVAAVGVGAGQTIAFASDSIDAPYNKQFMKAAEDLGYKVVGAHKTDRLALNTRTGEIASDFNCNELRKK